MDMADTISVILEYLKSHQLVKTEAALQDELRALLTDEVDSELRMQVCNNENDATNEQPEQAHALPNAIQQEAEMAKDNLFNTSPLETKDASALNDPAVSNDGRLKIKLRCLETAGSERVELEMLPENQSGNAGIEPRYDTEEAFSVNEARQHASMKADVGCSSPTKLEKHNISIKGGVIVSNAGLREEKPGLLWVLPERQAEEQSQSVRMLDSLQKAGHFQEHEGSVNAVLSEIRKDIEQADNSNAACGENTDDGSMSNLNMIRPLAVVVQHQENVQLTCGNSQRDQCSCRKETIDWNGQRTLACVEVSGNSDSCKDQTLEGIRSGQEDREGYPRLAPVRLKTVDGSTNECSGNSRKSSGSERFGNMEVILENCCSLGSYLDIPVGQSGLKHLVASFRPSVTQDIIRGKSDIQELRHGDIVASYKDEFWDSDAYEDDDDPGYVRRTIEDEAWFLANEINYPSDGDRRKDVDGGNRNLDKEYGKYSDDERSCMESYYSGEDYFRQHRDDVQHGLARTQDNELVSLAHLTSDYNENLLGSEELDQIQADAAWQGFLEQGKLSEKLKKSETILDTAVPVICDHFLEIGTSGIGDSRSGINSKERLLVSEGSEGGSTSCQGSKDLGNCSSHSRIDLASNSDDVSGKIDLIGEFQEYAKPTYDDGTYVGYYVGDWLQESCAMEKKSMVVGTSKAYESTCGKGKNGLVRHFQEGKAVVDVGDFSFPSSSSTVEGKSCSAKETSSHCDDMDDFSNDFIGPDDTLATWRRKSNCSSPIISLGEDADLHCPHSDVSGHSSDVAISVEAQEDAQEEEAAMQMEEAEVSAAYDEEAMAVHQHIQRLQAEEEEFETFNLKIIHRRSRTGFEEEKDFPIVINSVVAGRYHVTEYLGSAAFSNAIQAHDLYTGMDVCMKIIKNNKDFFDQSLDEIKLLKYINKHDPADKHHILRLYDYFYHREHLFIVCELLRANLYEFQKYKRESGGEVYFTMPRLQSITRQCLEALDFLHGLGLIHCDLKPENILVKSYSRCEVKVIDFGSSCFQTDHLCSYVQSRSYRAPEVILGLPYDQKIDIWSLGCILAELWTGNVLFQNDSLATLLARIVGIIGPVEPEMLSKGRDSYRYFTRNYMLYERNAETEHLEYLLPKKTSLKHRLPGGDEGFIEFVSHLLQVNPTKRPMAKDALKHSWLSYPYEPISS